MISLISNLFFSFKIMNLVSPVTKNKKGTVIHSGRRQCAVNIYKSVRTENPLMSKDEVVKRTAEFSGISKRSIYRIISEYQTNKTTKSPKNKKPQIYYSRINRRLYKNCNQKENS